MADWTAADIPPQRGRQAIITGATGGLGYETALALARAGADVMLTGRNDDKGRDALAKIRAQHPAATVAFERLDLARLASVSEFARRCADRTASLDLLINNAGVMAPPTRRTTVDGFELQFGTNYLSHFALTAHLLPLLRRGRQPRIVNISSLAHRRGAIHVDDLQAEHEYKPWRAYAQSKLAMLLFAFELQRRSDAGEWGVMSNAAHPGFARTELIANGPASEGGFGIRGKIGMLFQPLISHSSAAGALSTLFAATSPDAKGGGYYGPGGFHELKGSPVTAHVAPQATDPAVAATLWTLSEQLTGARWPTLASLGTVS
jgi:NAD(P)-dependent dehydrogenase (short-subunit alcohol dehydrogenase family)